jgi:dihydroxyacid dehydratase/phosphogluconate dehydratase
MDMTPDLFDEISRRTPNLCSIIPAGTYEMADIDQAGGIPAVLNRLADKIQDSPTVNGASIREIAAKGRVLNDDVIRTPENAYHVQGGIAVLKGNLAKSSVIKQTAVQKEMMVHSGPAKVFFTERDLIDALGAKEDLRRRRGGLAVSGTGRCARNARDAYANGCYQGSGIPTRGPGHRRAILGSHHGTLHRAR